MTTVDHRDAGQRPATRSPTSPTTPARQTKREFTSDQEVRWCPGCGDYVILAAVQSFLPELGLKRENIVFVSGIGCSSRFPHYMKTYGFHGIHGRAFPYRRRSQAGNETRPRSFVNTGDGDCPAASALRTGSTRSGTT